MENNAKIEFFKAFNKCQGALSPVKADSSNLHFGNRYPSLAAVMDAVRPFIEAGFSFIHEGVTISGKAFLRTSMVYNDYERVSDWPLVDDGNPQHLASASTYAKRYSISGLTGLVIDTDDDGNAAAGEKSSLKVPAKLSESVPQKNAYSGLISEPQRKRFYAIWKGAGKNPDDVKAKLREVIGEEDSALIPTAKYEALCEWAAVSANE